MVHGLKRFVAFCATGSNSKQLLLYNYINFQIDNECRICLDVPSATAFLPCGHFCACESCAKLVEHCPICRGDITQCVKIYKS